MPILSICAFGPLLVWVERAGGMRSGTHLDVIVWGATGHWGQIIVTVRIVDRLRVRRVVRSVADGMAIGLWVTRVRIDFVASKDDGALMIDEDVLRRDRRGS